MSQEPTVELDRKALQRDRSYREFTPKVSDKKLTLIEQYGLEDLPSEKLLAWAGVRLGLSESEVGRVMKTPRRTIGGWVESISSNLKPAD
jgi:hypothetical protein